MEESSDSLIIRDLLPEDMKTVTLLNSLQKDFKISGIEDKIIDKIVFQRNTPVAYGIVKKMAEAIILLHPHQPKNIKMEVMMGLMKYAELGAKRSGCEQLHVFVKDTKLIRTLEKSFGFSICEDIILCKNL